MLIVKDLLGNEEIITDFRDLSRNRKVNGEKTISLTLSPTKYNQHSFPMVEEESIITFDGEEYVIKKLTEKNIGNTYRKKVTGIHKFYVDQINKQQPKIHNGSITFDAYMQLVFEETGYSFVSLDTFYARSFENLGNDNRLALLQKGLERFKAEMEIVSTQVRFKSLIGNDTDFQFRYGVNIKTIEKNVDTSNLATVIRGTGAEGVTAYYRSPNADIFGEIEAPPVNDERFTSEETLLEEMKSRLQDTPEFSIKIDFEDLRAAGYPWTVPNEGDRVFVIYEPMKDMLIETRILEINEVFDVNLVPIKTQITLANYKKTFADTMFGNVQKKLKDIINDDGMIKYSVLDEAVRIAAEALQSAQTELEFTNGIIARSKENPNHLVLVNSSGIGVSLDGGQTFETAMTAEGFVADLITVGTMLFDRLQGGTLKLGHAYANGVLEVWVDRDEDGQLEIVARIDDDGAYFPNLSSDNIRGNVVNKWMGSKNMTFYIDCNNGNDSNDGLSTSTPKKSLQAFINSLPRDLNSATLTLRCKGSHSGTLAIENFKNGFFQIAEWDESNYLNTNYVWAQFCDYVLLQNVVVWGTGGTNAMVHAFYCNFFYAFATKCYGGPSQSNAYWMVGSNFSLNGCEVYGITDRGLYADRGSNGTVINAKGNPPVAVLVENGGIVNGYGSIWAGSKVARDGGFIPNASAWSSINTGTSSPPEPSADQNAEQTLTITPSTGDNYSSQGFWTNDEVKQGNWGYGDRYGLWYADLSAVKGKTIVSASITLTRKSGGASGTRTAYLRSHNYTSRGVRPGGTPAMSAVGATAALEVGQTGTFDITTMIQNHIANGTDKALGVHTTGTANYMILGTTPTITIRYR